MRPVNFFYVHCSATPPNMDIGADEIRDWHVNDNGWSDIGYHWVIRRDGVIEKGRDLDGDGEVDDDAGAHAFGHNADSVGICLVGGWHGDFDFTLEQVQSLKSLWDYYRARYNGIQARGHRDIPGVTKTCPNFDVRSLLNGGHD